MIAAVTTAVATICSQPYQRHVQETMLPKTNAWFHRMHWPSSGRAGLGFGLELWLTDPSGYEGYDQLRVRVSALRRRWTRRDYAAELSRDLLSEVLVAVGGVEQARADFRAALGRAQAWADQNVKKQLDVPHGIQNEDVTLAWYEFANVLSWARTIEERMNRRPRPVSKGSPPLRRQGLAPAIGRKRLKKRVDKLMAELHAGPLSETRLLANRTLHSGLVRHSFSGADLDETGRVVLPIPDPISAPTYHWNAFTWQLGRNAESFVEDLWVSVEAFMDGLLDAFEEEMPKRLRK